MEVRTTRSDLAPPATAPVRTPAAPPVRAGEPARVGQPVPEPRPRPQPVSAGPTRPQAQRVEQREARRSEPEPRQVAVADRTERRAEARPSFACGAARTASERLVCRDPQLARMDRDLNRAFEDAVASGVPRRALRREQDSWLEVRESAADDPEAVADVYALRIRELREMAEAPPDDD